ncbi:MAG: aspartate-semialdehyde dehydrogenase [Pseudomonadota bacterium]
MARSAIDLQLKDYRLTTADILYRLPDHQTLLQSYIWQDYDLAPHFPELHKFLEFWEKNLDGPLYSVTVASHEIIKAPTLRNCDGLFTLQ